MVAEVAPRPVTTNEAAILARAVESLPEGQCRDELARQLDTIRVVGGLPLFVDLESDVPLDSDCFPGRSDPIEGSVVRPNGEATGGVLVWIRDGAIRALECFSYEDVEPADFPDPSLVRFDQPSRDIPRR